MKEILIFAFAIAIVMAITVYPSFRNIINYLRCLEADPVAVLACRPPLDFDRYYLYGMYVRSPTVSQKGHDEGLTRLESEFSPRTQEGFGR